MGLNQSVVLVDAFLTTYDSFTFEMCSFVEKTGDDGKIYQIQDWEDKDFRRTGKTETIDA